ncbi:hypothetical protein [Singulisphaera acidiphila]|uniref:Uncharacterized protein n=1 Tax=Singulisphaera acidiphila (strain ATCC BAA-1392 / DSM 18658 / VKM B-2454 / MOB10) TaxID=886293 RepID=L0DBM4_SINAD|nr:hypothetical protein [Singulisphaera acidiphila]AGA26056.1 hypothetical protein Sinac_1680 [Singulisphaera acidiphila DSM 18658]
MTRVRFTLTNLMAFVLYFAFGFAALRNANAFWASATYTMAILLIAGALVGAITRRGSTRAPWVGFAVFGWTYLLIAHLPKWDVGGLGFGPIDKPLLFIEWGTALLQPHIRTLPLGMNGEAAGNYLIAYEQVSQSLGIILFGIVGAILSHLLAVKDDRPSP